MTMEIKLNKESKYNFSYCLVKHVLSYVDMSNVLDVSMFYDFERNQYVVCFVFKLNFVKQKGIYNVYVRFSYRDMQAYLDGKIYTDVLFKEHLIKGFALKRA